MYLMFVDESGDPGLVNSPTEIFVLSAIVIHELRWRDNLDALNNFRAEMRRDYDLKLREEIHSAKLIGKGSGSLSRISKSNRLAIIRRFADSIAEMDGLNIINVVVDKQGKLPTYDVFGSAWEALIQRFENTIAHHNFTGPANAEDYGVIFPDHTCDKRLSNLIRQMRYYNPIPNRINTGYRNLPLLRILEDPNFRDSEQSYFVQACDLVAFLLYQHLRPSAYMRRKYAQNYFLRLTPALCTVASTTDPLGIVRL